MRYDRGATGAFDGAVAALQEQVIFGPGHFVLADVERLDRHLDLWPLVLLPATLALRAADAERASGDWDHLEPDLRVGDGALIGLSAIRAFWRFGAEGEGG